MVYITKDNEDVIDGKNDKQKSKKSRNNATESTKDSWLRDMTIQFLGLVDALPISTTERLPKDAVQYMEYFVEFVTYTAFTQI